MLSKAIINIPYYCNKPLCANTTWLAVPLLVSAKGKELTKTFDNVKNIINSVPDVISKIPNDSFSVSLLAFDSTFEELTTTMEFYELNENEFQARIYNYVVMKFPDQGRMALS